jgi:outer membrane protein assembly factor BamB
MVRTIRLLSRAVMPVLLAVLLLAACGKPAAPSAATAEASTAEADAPASPAPVQQNAPAAPSLPAEVIFGSGEVDGQHDGTWSDLEVGTKLGKGDAVKVGAASECQLKFADMAVVSIRENTQVSIDSLILNQSTSQVKLGLKSGTVLSKVKKLSGGERFAVRTETAVGGVRGTEFGVTVTPQGATLVSVKDGTVAVLPAAYDPDDVRSMSAVAVPGLEQIAKEIESSAPAVHAGQELTVTPEQAAKAETSFQVVQSAAVQVVKEEEARQVTASSQSSGTTAPPAPTAAELEARTKAIQAATATLASVVGAPKALTPAHGQALKRIDALPAPSAPVSALPPAAPSAAPAPSKAPSAPPAAAPVRISVTATPEDSEIELNGKVAATGTYEAEVNPGDSVTLVIRHEGYATKTVAVTAKGPASYPVQLQPMPIEAAFPAGSAPLVGSVQTAGGILVSADRQGQLAGFDRQGRALWKLATQNTPNENSSPVIGSENLYFTGSKEFLVVAVRTGAVVSRAALDSSTTHLFGQRVAVSPTLGVLPTSTSLVIFNPASGATVRQIPIPGGTLMSPTISDGRVLLVNQAGVFLAVDPESSEVLFQVPTGASQPVASSVLVSGSKAYFADRKGTVVCVDMDARKVAWKVSLKGQATGVFQDLEASAGGIYAFAGNAIHALSASDGSELFPPIGGASTPPLDRGGRLYFGTQSGTLAVVDERTGKTVKSLELKAVAATRPKADGSRLLFGSTTGQVFVVYPDSIP